MGCRLWRHRGGRAGLVVAAVLVGLVVLGPLGAGDPTTTDFAHRLDAPSWAHWLGTDHAGRDLLGRTVSAARTSLGAAALVTLLTLVVGTVVGSAAGYLRGPVDVVLSRLVDVVLGLPDLVLALAIVGTLGPGHSNLVLALALSGWAPMARLARALALDAPVRLDVVSARLAGVGRVRVVVGHVLPGMLTQLAVLAASGFGAVVLSLAGLSFLGLGAEPSTPELGRMLSDSQSDLARQPWVALGPGIVLTTTVAAATLLSDALRDLLDPMWTALASRSRPRRWVQGPPFGGENEGDGEALRLDSVSVTYADGTRALRDVSLVVVEDECLAIVGASGCGKTTLAKTILALLPASADVGGRVQVAGRDVAAMDERTRRSIRGRSVGYVAQDPFASFDPLRTVGANVAEAWRAHGRRPPDDLADRIADLGIDRAAQRLRQRPHQWSGGMLQRASIAAAVAHEPPLVVADEPTSALDAVHADGVLETLRSASRTLVLVSHDLGLVAAHADRIAVMHEGGIVELGPTHEVIDRPQHPVTRALLAASPRSRGPASREPSRAGTEEAVVDLVGVSRAYRTRRGRVQVQAVADVSLSLHAGEIVGITGPSGCGKSTLLRLAVGLERPDAGEVLHQGHPRHPHPGEVMALFQDPFASLDPRWPIWRSITQPLVVGHPGLARADRRATARQWLTRVRLDGVSPDARPHELSGGQCQRVALARALAAQPTLLVVDEPTARQDVLTSAALADLLRDTAGHGTAILIASHDTSWLASLCDRVVPMGEGTTPPGARRLVSPTAPGLSVDPPDRRRSRGPGRRWRPRRCPSGPRS